MPDFSVLILLPSSGLGGVTSWAEWLAGAVGARIVDAPDPAADFDAAVAACRAEAGALLASGSRLVLLPQLSGHCYAAACTVAHSIESRQPGLVSVAGWMHTDIRYDTELLRRFAPALSGVATVSKASAAALADFTEASVVRTGVAAPDYEPVERSGPLRLIYTGRIERSNKRVLALPATVAALRRSGIEAELTAVGHGPDAEAFDRACADVGACERLSPRPLAEFAQLLAASDLYVLPSRTEGLGLGRIEAALCGCAPVVCAGSAGALEGIMHGVSGIVAESGPDADEQAAGQAIADAIAEQYQAAGRAGLRKIAGAAKEAAEALFEPASCVATARRFLAESRATDQNRSSWATIAEQPARYANFTVPLDAGIRVRAALARVRADEVILYGAGAHTEAIWPSVASSGVNVKVIIDDDPARHGGAFGGVPIVSHAEAIETGVKNVLISSWLHEDALWAKRARLEAAGMNVHCVYAAASSPESRASSA